MIHHHDAIYLNVDFNKRCLLKSTFKIYNGFTLYKKLTTVLDAGKHQQKPYENRRHYLISDSQPKSSDKKLLYYSPLGTNGNEQSLRVVALV